VLKCESVGEALAVWADSTVSMEETV